MYIGRLAGWAILRLKHHESVIKCSPSRGCVLAGWQRLPDGNAPSLTRVINDLSKPHLDALPSACAE